MLRILVYLFCLIVLFWIRPVFRWLNLMELICFIILSYLYPCWVSLLASLRVIFLNSFGLVRKYLLVVPLVMAFTIVGGWYEVACVYSCLFVGFMWVRISSIRSFWNLLPLYKVMSKNVNSVSLNSYVNFMVSCTLFRLPIYVLKSALDPVQMTNMSSMNCFQIRMCGLPNCLSLISNFPMNKFA